MQEENIVFHHVGQSAGDDEVPGDGNENDYQRQKEMDAYRNKFEEAMIRIEDEEDVEAYREAKAELDDEFKEELLEAQVIAGEGKEEATTVMTEANKEDEVMIETEGPNDANN